MSRPILIAFAWLFTGSFVGGTAPNIVLILADDMGYGDVRSLNSDSKIPTPHLDRLARDGMTFTDGHSPSAVCTPTRYGLLTGRYCWRTKLKNGVLGGYSAPLIATDRSTLGTLLQRHGYRTHAVGKWHLGMKFPLLKNRTVVKKWDDPGVDYGGVISDSPIHHGFDFYFGVSASLDMSPYVFIRDDRFTELPTEQQPGVPFPYFIRSGPRAPGFVVEEVLDRLTDEATRVIRTAGQNDSPFFLYMPLTAPHKPTQPHSRFRGVTELGEYGDFIVQVDATVGDVLDTIDQVGIREDTIVIYTSDNGSYMYQLDAESEHDHVTDSKKQGYFASHHRANGSFRGTKADIWEAGHHVPLFIRWPGKVQPGSRCNQTVCLTDWYATFAEILGAKVGEHEAEDSCSLLPLLHGQDVSRPAPVVHHSVGGMFAIRDGKWKLILGNGSGGRETPRGKPFGQPYQLFDLSVDVGESHDVASQHPDVVRRLTDFLTTIQDSGRSVLPNGS